MEDKKNVSADAIHNIVMENRGSVSISGVEDVENFNEDKVIMLTQMGTLSIEGKNLHISSLSVDTGDVQIEGEFDSLTYSDGDRTTLKSGFFSRLFQ